MLIPITAASSSRLMVVAYDITCPQRARAIRRILDPIHSAKQLSVYEVNVTRGAQRRVFSKLSACTDATSDRLMTWRPINGLRLIWKHGKLIAEAQTNSHYSPTNVPPNLGNFILCHDVSDPKSLRSISALIAAESVMLQRSVYQLRAPTRFLSTLLRQCGTHMDLDDRLWAYPLHHS